MLPVILGGIAMAAVGFKLKEHCDNNGKGCDALSDGLLKLSDMLEDIEEKFDGPDPFNVTADSPEVKDAVEQYSNRLYIFNQLKAVIVDTTFNKLANDTALTEALKTIGFTLNVPKVEKDHYALTIKKEEERMLLRYSGLVQEINDTLEALIPQLESAPQAEQEQIAQKVAIYATLLLALIEEPLCDEAGKLSTALEVKMLEVMKVLLDVKMRSDIDYQKVRSSL